VGWAPPFKERIKVPNGPLGPIGGEIKTLTNKTKHQAKFLAKRYPFFILDFGLKRKKKAKKPSPIP
jgi:hypothetical protein